MIYATFPTTDEACRIGAELVGMRLAACVNVIPGMLSIYRWQGATHQAPEAVAVIKTEVRLTERVVGAVRVLHSYTNPALLAVPVVGGSLDFLDWIVTETS